MPQLDWITRGGPIMYPLLACSLVAVTIAIERCVFWFRHRRNRDATVIARMCTLVSKGCRDDADTLGAGSRDPLARIFRAGLSGPPEAAEGALEMAAASEIRGMKRYLKVLDTIVTLAPLLGILGTVMGIIVSFDVIGGGRIDNPIEITGGIAEALLTTATGLVVAIIALLPYNYFSARLEDAVSEMESNLTGFQHLLERGGGPP